MTHILTELVGKTLVDAYATDSKMTLVTDDPVSVVFYHEQDCCEHVYIESIVGDLADLVGHPLIMAEIVYNQQEEFSNGEFEEWTFYKFATIKGYVDVRWCGSSNGYYSMAVSCKVIDIVDILKEDHER